MKVNNPVLSKIVFRLARLNAKRILFGLIILIMGIIVPFFVEGWIRFFMPAFFIPLAFFVSGLFKHVSTAFKTGVIILFISGLVYLLVLWLGTPIAMTITIIGMLLYRTFRVRGLAGEHWRNVWEDMKTKWRNR